MCVFVTRSVHVYFNWSFSQQCDYIGTPSNNEPSTLSTIPISLFDSSSTSFTTASLPQQIEIESHGPKNRPAKLTTTTTKIRKEITQSCPMQQGEIKIRKRRVCFFVGALREFLNRDHLQVGRESEQEVVPF